MKSRLVSIIFAVLTVSAFIISHVCMVNAQGNSQGSSNAYKIGIVNLQRVMDNYDKQVAEIKALEDEDEKIKVKFKKLSDALEADFETFRKERDSLTEDQRLDGEEELQKRVSELDAESRQEKNRLTFKLNRLKQTLLKDIVAAVEEIGTAENYHLILEADVETRTGVLYHSSTLNMTQKVIDKLNSK